MRGRLKESLDNVRGKSRGKSRGEGARMKHCEEFILRDYLLLK